MTGLRTGELAEAAGVNTQTLRYYERRGLLAEPRRSLGGHRLYPEQAVTVLRVIKAAQRLGFTPPHNPTPTSAASSPPTVACSSRARWPGAWRWTASGSTAGMSPAP